MNDSNSTSEGSPKINHATLLSAALVDESANFPAPELIGGYEILEEIGKGAVGVVYRAIQPKLQREVALKVMLSSELAGQDALKQFENEIQILTNLEHPNVLTLYDIGDGYGFLFYSMSLQNGGSLGSRFSNYQFSTLLKSLKSGRKASYQTARFFKGIADGVHHGHMQGVLHRDLKPENILIDRNGNPVVGDFGLGLLTSSKRCERRDTISGSIPYMAPEQLAGKPLSVGMDVYAMGVMLYEVLTGRRPFPTNSTVRDFQSIDKMIPEHVDQRLWAVCLKCLKEEVSERYPSAQSLSDDLQRVITSRPVRAKPTNWLETYQLWTRRNPIGAALMLFFNLALVLAFLGITHAWKQASLKQRVESEYRQLVEAKQKETEEELVKILMEQADSKARSGNWSKGLQLYGQALKKASNDPKLSRQIARLYNAWARHYPRIMPHSDAQVYALASTKGWITTFAEGKTEVFVWPPSLDPTEVIKIQLSDAPIDAIFDGESESLFVLTQKNLSKYDVKTGSLLARVNPQTDAITINYYKWRQGTRLVLDGTRGQIIEIGDSMIYRSTDTLEMVANVDLHPGFSRLITNQLSIYHAKPTSRFLLYGNQLEGSFYNDLKTQQHVKLSEHGFRTASVSADQKWIVMADHEGNGSIHDTQTGRTTGTFGGSARIEAITFFEESTKFLTAGRNRSVSLWEIHADGRATLLKTYPHPLAVTRVQLLAEGFFVTCCEDKLMRVFHVDNPTPVRLLPAGQGRSWEIDVIDHPMAQSVLVSSIRGQAQLIPIVFRDIQSYNAHGQICAIRKDHGRYRLQYNYPNPGFAESKTLDAIQPKNAAQELYSLWSRSISSQGDWSTFVTKDGTMFVLDTTGSIIKSIVLDEQIISHAQADPRINGAILATRSGDLLRYDFDKAQITASIELGAVVNAIEISPQQNFFVVATHEGSIRSHRLDDLSFLGKIPDLKHDNLILNMTFSPDGSLLATGGMDKQAILWKVPELLPVSYPLPHRDYYWTAAFSANSEFVATGGQEMLIRLWDTESGYQMGPEISMPDWVNALRFDPQKPDILIAATSDQQIHEISMKDFYDCLTHPPLTFEKITGLWLEAQQNHTQYLSFEEWFSRRTK
jgi:serine/threonine protein kinase/WD40 repeat protein